MTAPIALMPIQSATRSSPGLPASASRFSVCWVNDVLAMLDIRPERRFMSGRSVRSASGAWSSSSSRFLACMVPSWLRRAWTGSTDGLLASPMKINRIAPAAIAATTRGRTPSMRLDLDIHDLPDEHEAHEHREAAKEEDDHAERAGPRRPTRLSNMGSMKPGAAMNRKPARPIGRKPTT